MLKKIYSNYNKILRHCKELQKVLILLEHSKKEFLLSYIELFIKNHKWEKEEVWGVTSDSVEYTIFSKNYERMYTIVLCNNKYSVNHCWGRFHERPNKNYPNLSGVGVTFFDYEKDKNFTYNEDILIDFIKTNESKTKIVLKWDKDTSKPLLIFNKV